jgi:hypothetical protein
MIRGSELSEIQKIVRIFIGSPGGLELERQAAHDVINSVNRSHSDHWGIQLRLLGWETALPGFSRPQDKINEDLDKCDYFIGVLWNHWGSRPARDDSGPTSGFEEEYLRAEERIRSGFIKDMALYFKTIPTLAGYLPNESMQKVIDFRNQCIAEKKHFFKDFVDVNDFREIVRSKLEEIGWRETRLFQQEERPADQAKRTTESHDIVEDTTLPSTYLIDGPARNFVAELLRKSSDWESITATDVARLRLLGSAFKRSGNDDYYLGAHDANLVYEQMKQKDLTEAELRGVLDSGVVGFQIQNVPLWNWISKEDHSSRRWNRIKVLAAFGTDAEKRNAITILDLLSSDIPAFDEFYDKKKVLKSWLAEGGDPQVFNAAITYLSGNASREDLILMEEIAADMSPFHKTKIEAGIVGVMSRIDANAALARLVGNEVDKIDDKIAGALFQSPQSLSTETLRSCLSAKPDNIRLSAAQLLSIRNEITEVLAHDMLTDSNHEIRLLAAESLRNRGSALSEDVAKEALRIIKPKSGLLGFLTKRTDDTYYDQYRIGYIRNMSYGELRAKIDEGNSLSHRELIALIPKYSRKLTPFLRENLDDLFDSYFEIQVIRDKNQGVLTEDLEREVRNMKSLVIRKICTVALAAVTSQSQPEDIHLVRKVLDNGAAEAEEAIIRYLGKFGDWSDINRIKVLGEGEKSQKSLFDLIKTALPDQKADAILSLGKSRVTDMLEIEMDNSIRLRIAKKLPKRLVESLRDEILIRELERPVDAYRRMFALRCVQSLPKSRIAKLLDRYMHGTGHYFYNSVHWLDLGVAFQTHVARDIALKAVERTELE